MKITVQTLLLFIFGVLFIVSGASKLFPVEFFELELVEKGVSSWNIAPFIARIAIAFEIALGLLLITYLPSRVKVLK